MVMEPISVISNQSTKITKEITVRPLKQSGIDLLGHWLNNQTWKEVLEAETVDEKSKVFQNLLLMKIEEFLPQKRRKVSYVDQPFCTEQMKRLEKLKSRDLFKQSIIKQI